MLSCMPRRPRSPEPEAPSSAAPFVPPRPTLPGLRAAAAGCRGCHLWERGTQTVFGEGPRGADVVLVGEQPGDREDREGRPFVGPAGRLLESAIAEAGLDRARVYLTNVVKHFKWEPRGKRRIHQKPDASEIAACRPWLEAELAVIRPAALVCLGATAARALLGKDFKVTQHRGQVRPGVLAPLEMGTVHPSSILRAPDDEARRRERERFVEDLRALRRALERAGVPAGGSAPAPPG
ncbi:MAG TPA: UdgX family uracil-DNA binding protein [Anaeromyxobacteraceae bacterium]